MKLPAKYPKYILLSFLLLNSYTFFAQIYDWQWAKKASGNGHDEANDITVSADGSIYVTGSFNGGNIDFDGYNLTSFYSGNWNMYVVKYDPLGNVLWAKSATGAGAEGGVSVATDSDGNCYVAGSFRDASMSFTDTTLVYTPGTQGSRDGFIVKYSADGALIWAKKIGGAGDEGISSISLLPGNALFVTGRFYGASFDFDGTILSNHGMGDVYTAKIDAIGQTIWAKNYGGSKDDDIDNSSTDANGNCFITGNFYSPLLIIGNDTLLNSSGVDPFVMKFDNQGNVLWAKSGVGAWAAWGHGITTDPGGNCYIAGSFIGDTILFDNIRLNNTLSYINGIFLVKYTPNGQIVWAKTAAGNHSDVMYDISADNNGNIYATGNFSSDSLNFGGPVIYSNGNADIFVVKYTPDGHASWAKSVHGNDLDEGISISADNSGNCYVTGHFASESMAFGGDTLTNINAGLYDVFVAKLGGTSGTTNVAETAKFELFPNPGNGQIVVKSPYVIDKIIITRMDGQVILEETPGEQSVAFELEKSGLYIVTITSGNQSISKKLIITQ